MECCSKVSRLVKSATCCLIINSIKQRLNQQSHKWPTGKDLIHIQSKFYLQFKTSQITLFILTLLLVVIHSSNQSLLMPSANKNRLYSSSNEGDSFPESGLTSFASARHVYPRARERSNQVANEQHVSKRRHLFEPNNSDLIYAYEVSEPDRLDIGSLVNKTSGEFKLTLLQNQLVDLRNQFELELASQTHKVTLGSPCSKSIDCTNSLRNTHCKLDNFTCSCLPNHVQYNSTICLQPSLLGYECLIDAQCQQKVPNSKCLNGLCSCPSEFVPYRKDKCLPASPLNEYCLADKQCQLSDGHSFCNWKIPHVYGRCKCPPNYKLINFPNVATNNGNKTRCAPRLGDSCFDTDDCLLVTQNSQCLEIQETDIKLRYKWRTSEVSKRRCYCASGFMESKNKLECKQVVESVTASSTRNMVSFTTTPATTTIASTTKLTTQMAYEKTTVRDELEIGRPTISQIDANREVTSLSQSGSMIAKNKYQLVIANNQSSSSSNTTASAMTNAMDKRTTSRPTMGKVRVSSLGKSCNSKYECKARDPYSDCIGGFCECIKPSSGCSSNSTGCHADTFQCRNGQCISWYFVCDQFKNCDDGSDEEECQVVAGIGKCPPEAFQCDNGHCLARGKLCNGMNECGDNSDERLCGNSSAGSGSNSMDSNIQPVYLTAAKPEQTGLAEQASGGLGNVSAASVVCHPRAFACANGRQCLPAYVFCNAVEDCADGSDEFEALCERNNNAKWPPPKQRWPTLADNGSLQHANATNLTSTLVRPSITATPTRIPSNQSADDNSNNNSPLIKVDKESIYKMLAALNLVQRTPETRGRLHSGRSNKAMRDGPVMLPKVSRQRQRQNQHQQPVNGECPKSTFTCRNGKCRSSAILCSGVDGCGDNSDEDRCEVCQCQPV